MDNNINNSRNTLPIIERERKKKINTIFDLLTGAKDLFVFICVTTIGRSPRPRRVAAI